MSIGRTIHTDSITRIRGRIEEHADAFAGLWDALDASRETARRAIRAPLLETAAEAAQVAAVALRGSALAYGFERGHQLPLFR